MGLLQNIFGKKALPIEAIYSDKAAFEMFSGMRKGISDTEWTALTSGTVGYEASLFTGKPDWKGLFETPAPGLTEEEQSFLDNEVEELCGLVDDWKVRNELYDLPQEAWDYLKEKKFFGMIIPKKYGGLGFSAQAHAAVVSKISSRSGTAAATAMVPNSLGPAELLLNYGTEEQREHYLPLLATGKEIPCFSLTSPTAGSDAAGGLLDTGVVFRDEDGDVKIKMNWEKRYITLAPIATLMGMAYNLKDPEGLLAGDGKAKDYGITVSLIPADTPGISRGLRHHPVATPIQNGPHWGKDVVVPLDTIVGGTENAGKGWPMLTSQLAVGRSISLPASASGSARYATRATGAYAMVREQFGLPIGYMEGIQTKLAEIAGLTYMIDAARTLPLQDLDVAHAKGKEAKPAVASAMLKYNTTEAALQIAIDSVKVHGGKAVMDGPNNPAAHLLNGVPVGITVEGHNILTRDMITFGQGAILAHPYSLPGLLLANTPDDIEGVMEKLKETGNVLARPDKMKQLKTMLEKPSKLYRAHVLWGMARYAVNSLVSNLTGGRFTSTPETASDTDKRFFQHINRLDSSFTFLANTAMGVLQADLKRKENISGAFADAYSNLYMASQVLRRWHLQGSKQEDAPLMEWACRHCLHNAEEALSEVIDNFPKVGGGLTRTFLRATVLPAGAQVKKPSHELNRKVASIITTPGEARDRLTDGMYMPSDKQEYMNRLERAFELSHEVIEIKQAIKQAMKAGTIEKTKDPQKALESALAAGVVDKEAVKILQKAEEARDDIIGADSFDSSDWNTPPVNPTGNPKSFH